MSTTVTVQTVVLNVLNTTMVNVQVPTVPKPGDVITLTYNGDPSSPWSGQYTPVTGAP